MAMRLYRELRLESPVLTAGWPGIGDICTIAVDIMRERLGVEELGELEQHHFFYPIASLDPQEHVRIPLVL